MIWLVWILLCGCMYIECKKYEWKQDPWYGRSYEQWANIPDQGNIYSNGHGNVNSKDQHSHHFQEEFQLPPHHYIPGNEPKTQGSPHSSHGNRDQGNMHSNGQQNIHSQNQEHIFSKGQEHIFSSEQEHIYPRGQENLHPKNQYSQHFSDIYQFSSPHYKFIHENTHGNEGIPQQNHMTGHRAIYLRLHKKGEHSSEDEQHSNGEESSEDSDPLENCRSPNEFIDGPVHEPDNPDLTPTKQNPLPLKYGSYDEEPSVWPCFYKKCRGNQQSPINLDTEVIKPKPELGPLEFQNYDKKLKNLLIKNAGLVVYLSIPQCANVTVTSKWLKDTYRLFRVSIAYNRSLHTVDSKYFQMEITMLHLNTKYRSVEDQPDALLGVDILFQVKKTNNKKLNPIIDVLKDIKKIESNTTLKSPLAISDLLPKMNESYITYNGSRVVPQCSEIFKYVVFHYSNSIGKQQLEMFKRLQMLKPEDRDRDLVRPIQPLNEREIWSSMPAENGNDQKNGESNGNGNNYKNGWW